MPITLKNQRFINEYLIDLNATQAAIRAGYSKKTAYSIGHDLLKKSEIKEFIKKKFEEVTMTKDEALKLMSDIARSNLGDYFVKRQVKRSRLIEKPVKKIIQDLQKEIEFEKEYAKAAKLVGEELEYHKALVISKEREIIKLKIELKHNPRAKKIVYGPEEIVEESELDVSKVVADKERGRIKAVTPSEFGLKIEMYSADAAIANILKIHGAFEKDNAQKKNDIVVPMSQDQVKSVIDQLKQLKK